MIANKTRTCLTGAAFLLCTLLAATAVSADELLLRDGSRLLGTVGKKDNGTQCAVDSVSIENHGHTLHS